MFAPNISTCTEDIDCSPYLTNRLCVAGAQWLQPGDPECQCNYFYPFVQSQPDDIACSKLSFGSYLSLLVYFGTLVFNLTHLLLCSISLFRSISATRKRRQQKTSKWRRDTKVIVTTAAARQTWTDRLISYFSVLSAMQATALFMVISLVGGALNSIFTMLNFAVASGTPDSIFQSGIDGFGRYEWFTRTLTLPIFGVVGAGFGTMTISLAWIETAMEVENFALRKRQYVRPRHMILFAEGTLTVSAITAVTLESQTGLQFLPLLSAFYTFLSGVICWNAQRQIRDMLFHRIPTATAKLKKHSRIADVLKSVRNTAGYILFCTFSMTLVSLLYLIFTNGGDLGFHQPGLVFSWIRFAHHLIFLLLNFNNYAILQYIYPRLTKHHVSVWCVITHCCKHRSVAVAADLPASVRLFGTAVDTMDTTASFAGPVAQKKIKTKMQYIDKNVDEVSNDVVPY